MSKLRLIVMGHGEHGKGTVCQILQERYGYRSCSSSYAALQPCIWPAMQSYYDTMDECYQDRRNWRTLWGQLITRFNHDDKTELGRHIFEYLQCDIYDGIRKAEELNAIKKAGLIDYVVWVDGSRRKPMESSESMTVNRSMADITIDNNGPEHELDYRVRAAMDHLLMLGRRRAAA